jgi:dGTPase
LPQDWGGDLAEPAARARRIVDYIAGMTDRYALTEHMRWIGGTADLR